MASATAEIGDVVTARRVNVVLSNVKRALDRHHHALRPAKYARHYPVEAACCFNPGFHLHDRLPRLDRATMVCKLCPEPMLRIGTDSISGSQRLTRYGTNPDVFCL